MQCRIGRGTVRAIDRAAGLREMLVLAFLWRNEGYVNFCSHHFPFVASRHVVTSATLPIAYQALTFPGVHSSDTFFSYSCVH
jgi:hypothetical protein